MCYSAEAWTRYKRFVDEFGADVDMKAFVELYLARSEAYRTGAKASDTPKIPKGMDLGFLHPKTDDEKQVHELIALFNKDKVSEYEQELFKQVKRLADAERKLATKETKGALNEQRIATNKIGQLKRWIADTKRTKEEPRRDNRIFPDWYVPVLIVEEGKRVVRPMRYHLRPSGMDASTDHTKNGRVSGKYNARRDNLRRFWRNQFGDTHALMLAETFYENVDDGHGGSREVHFRPKTGETMYVACLWSKWTDPERVLPDLYSFAAITDEPEPEVAEAGHDRTIINIKPEYVDAWLNPQGSSLDALEAIFDDKRHPYYELIKQAA